MATKSVLLRFVFAAVASTATHAASREITFGVKCPGTSTVGDTNHDGSHAGPGTVPCVSNLWPLYVDSDGNGFAAQEEISTGTITLREK